MAPIDTRFDGGGQTRDTRFDGMPSLPPEVEEVVVAGEENLIDYYTSTWDVLQAIKYNLMEYRSNANALQIGTGDVNFGLGFILPRTLYPAITVFPLSKRFGGRRGSRQMIEYSVNIDIYSPVTTNLPKAKEWSLRMVDDVIECLKANHTLTNEDGVKNAFSTEISSVSTEEDKESDSLGSQLITTVSLTSKGFHAVSNNREPKIKKYANSSNFIEKVWEQVVNSQTIDRVKDWQHSISVPATQSPIVQILPGNEMIEDDFYVGEDTMIKRPINFYVVSNDYPKASILEENIKIADELVSVIELTEQVDSYSSRAIIEGITYDYNSGDAGFEFYSGISTIYDTYKQF